MCTFSFFQQAQPAFGQTSAFGAGAGGATPAFGQQHQQQPFGQAAPTGFGELFRADRTFFSFAVFRVSVPERLYCT